MKLKPYGPDDWLIELDLREPSGREHTKIIGVSHYVSEERAKALAINAVRRPRMIKKGQAPEILDIRPTRRWQRQAVNS